VSLSRSGMPSAIVALRSHPPIPMSGRPTRAVNASRPWSACAAGSRSFSNVSHGTSECDLQPYNVSDIVLNKFQHVKTSIVLANEDFLNASAVIRKALAIACAQMRVKP
jgi:hypothetical protein